LTYNADNRLVSRTNGGATTTYTYDGQGNLVKKTLPDGSWTRYVGDLYEKHSDGTYIKYYWALGRRVASRSDDGAVQYYLADHLGSSTQILDANGALQQSVKYYPYGSVRLGSMASTDKKFTGQQEEGTALGLYDYGARFYSTKLGRFLSPDPVAVGAGASQSLDRFSYVLNNPLRYTDPSGLCVTNPLTRKRDACDADIAYRYMVCSLSAGHCKKIAYEQQKRGLGGLEGVDLDKLSPADWKNVHKYSKATLWDIHSTRGEFRQSVRDIDWGSDSAGRSAKLYYDVGLEGLLDTANAGLGLYITLHYEGNTLPTTGDLADVLGVPPCPVMITVASVVCGFDVATAGTLVGIPITVAATPACVTAITSIPTSCF